MLVVMRESSLLLFDVQRADVDVLTQYHSQAAAAADAAVDDDVSLQHGGTGE